MSTAGEYMITVGVNMVAEGRRKMKAITEDTLIPLGIFSAVVSGIIIAVFYAATYAARIDKVEAHQKVQDDKIETIQEIKTDIAVIKNILQERAKK